MASDDIFYSTVAAEIEQGRIDKVLWTKAFSHSGGTEAATKSLYVRYRVEQLAEEARSSQLRTFTSSTSRILLDLTSSVLVAIAVAFALPFILSGGSSSGWDSDLPVIQIVIFVGVLPLSFVHFRQMRRRRSHSSQVTPK